MIPRAGLAARRLASTARPRLSGLTIIRASQAHNLIRPVVTSRSYASGRPHPPGGTHRMNLGEEPEKPALEQYGIDLTERAREGRLDPVIGRDSEIQRTIQILSRRTKNNPCLIGKAG